ncbi:hypothetical protein DCAR_0414990 [Daucus carota subsp. sativus]|uniref:DUF4283 domain-containing protein n=1 Tax=Daucus carota subsp. sativus TaxID=79200 RepID=A0AAF0WVY8_DAUCS|nr:hypothetical protein DCAR_0414990 [Daucus carota subsp. sativus]
MSRYQDLSVHMSSLAIDEEENVALVIEGNVDEESNKYELCAVGRFLTEKTVNVRAMKSKMANVWKPAMGVNIKELETGIFLFQSYHKEDLNWVLNGGPWSFDNVMLILDSISQGEEPLSPPLWHLKIWIQIHVYQQGICRSL